MGAWGENTFDNDTACDWTYELEAADDLGLVSATLDRVVSTGGEYLDSDLACEGLAACEVVARLKGNWGKRNPYTETADKWVESHAMQPPPELVNKAQAVIDRILREPSELLELWSESEELGKWTSAVDDLRSRVKA